ncbi:MAG: phosphoribosylformylglycinamidine cyclo-ligase [Actinomycetota bacterium]|nr:phosphoribosylformylglycinamidine cyclo-ligase [Actinomycetota bacterium]
MSSYSSAGVDIGEGERTVALLADAVSSTRTPRVLSDVGAFGGSIDISGLGTSPVLVASCDGVGTKTEVAVGLGRYRGLGHDVVNHGVNDVLVQGARPLFALDYVATSSLVPEAVAELVIGASEACRAVGCALLGGETAEMPGVYVPGAMDVVGTVVGVVEREALLPRSEELRAGDALIGMPSVGAHTNGYSLIRHILADHDIDLATSFPDDPYDRSWADVLCEPHHCYLTEVDALAASGVTVLALAHITGGGLVGNVPRVLPPGLAARIEVGSWTVPPLFDWLVDAGGVEVTEAHRTWNMGVGMVAIVPEGDADRAAASVTGASVIGQLVERGDGPAATLVAP